MQSQCGSGRVKLIPVPSAETTSWTFVLNAKHRKRKVAQKNATLLGVAATTPSISIVYRDGSRRGRHALLTIQRGLSKNMVNEQ